MSGLRELREGTLPKKYKQKFKDTYTKSYCGECEISCMCVCVDRSGGAGNRGSTAKQEHQLPKEEVGYSSSVFVFLSLCICVCFL